MGTTAARDLADLALDHLRDTARYHDGSHDDGAPAVGPRPVAPGDVDPRTLDAMRDELLALARTVMPRRREDPFLPLAVELSRDGRVMLFAGSVPTEEAAPAATPPATPPRRPTRASDYAEHVQSIVTQLRERHALGEVHAGGICFLTQEAPPGGAERGDAVLVHVETAAGAVTRTFWPFRWRFFGGIHFGEPFTKPAAAMLFVDRG